MPKEINGRPYLAVKTGIDDLQKLQEVKQSLVRQEGLDRLRQRARIRREFASRPLSSPVVAVTQIDKSSDTPYRVIGYDPDSDKWRVQSLENPGEQFMAYAIKAGGIKIGDLVRGYPPVAIEQQPQGRKFKPVSEPITTEKDVVITITIGYTGRR